MAIDPITGVVSDSVTIGGGPTGRGFQVPKEEYTKQQNLAASARARMAKDRGAIGKAASLGGFGAKSAGKLSKLKAPTKATVAEANQPTKTASKKAAPSKKIGSGNTRTRNLADGQATPVSLAGRRDVGAEALARMRAVKNKQGLTKAQVAAKKKPKKRYSTTPKAV